MRKITLTLFMTLAIGAFFSLQSWAAVITPTVCATETFAVSAGDIITDDGGLGGNCTGDNAAGNYANAGCVTTTTYTGAGLAVDFQTFGIWASFDWLKIYDGLDNTGTVLYDNAAGGANAGDLVLADMIASSGGTVFQSTTGALTFEFNATTVVNRCGWEALVTTTSSGCSLICPPDLTVSTDVDNCFATLSIPNPGIQGAACATSVVLLTEDFETGTATAAPAGWTAEVLFEYPSSTGGNQGIGACAGANLFSFTCTDVTNIFAPANAEFSGQIAQVDDDGAGSAFDGIAAIVSPVIDMSTAPGATLQFDYSFNDYISPLVEFRVEAYNGAAWDVLYSTVNDESGSLTLSLAAYSNTDFQVRFVHDDDADWGWGFGVDNVVISYADASAVTITNDFNNDVIIVDENFPLGTTTITFETIDASGNVVRCSTDVTVEDLVPPQVDCPSDLTLHATPGECEVAYSYNLNATENCPADAFALHQNLTWPTAVDIGLVCTAAPPGDYIQYFRVFDIANDAMLSSIDLGVEFTDGISPYTVEVWDITGQTISLATIAAAPQLLNVDVVTGAPIFRQIVNLPLPTTVLPGGSTIAISIGATGTANGQPGSAVGFDLTGETGPTYVNGCLNTAGVPAFIVDEISDLNLFSTRGLILALNLDLPNIIVTQTDGSGLTSGDLFPIGTTTQTWIHTDASGNADTCSFNITVEEFANPITDLACNDLVHLSPDQDCEILVTADMILEGGPYGCYDDYIVDLFYDIDMTQPVPTSPVATGAEVGLTLVVSVTDPTTGNSCWGYALVEDKLIPALECSAYEVDCDDDITAGTYPSGSVNSVTSLTPGTFITVGAPGVVEFPLALQGSFSSVTDVNVSFDVSHTWVADVTVKVTSPSGTSVQVLNSECGSFDDFVLSFDDAFPAPYSDIGANCSATPPAMSGEYKPANALSAFNGEEANGVWTVTFTDGVGGDDGTVNAITLEVSATTTSGIPLPLPEDAVATPASGTGPFVVSGFDPCGDVTLTYVDNVIDIDCTVADEPLTALVLRNWTAVDGYGNVTTCTDSISLRKADLATLALPVDRDDVDAPALSCNGGWDWNNDGIPQPAELGDDISAVCDLEVFWTDRIFYDACKTKILRDWVIVDDCTGEVLEHTQLIVIKNDVPPTIYCVEEMEVSTDHNSCSVDVNVPTPTIDFGCLTITDPCAYYTVTASAGTVVNYGGCAWKVLDMPVGVHTITYTVNDGCGNEAYCETTISVRDDVPPIPICDVNTRVSLGSDGVALIPASTFNDGSYDNCGPITIKVRRKYFGDCVPALSNNDRQWKDAEEFCCADIDDNPILVELGVWDASGNFNSCWVSVEVEDKLPPYIEAPEDITISCDFKFDLNNLSIFGGIAFDQSTRGYIVLDDVDYYDCLYGPDYSGPRPAINWGKEGYAADNCDVVIYENENIDMVCGRSKIVNGVYRPAITRVFTAEDPNGLTASDVQRIYIIDCDPFTILDTDTRCRDRGLFYTNKDDVEWPCDVELDGCAGADLSPDNTGRPIYTDDKCSIVADTFYDEVFTVVPDACFKILRHWSILDWCQYDPVTGYGRWDYTQVIKVNDEEAPVVIPSQPGCVDSIPDQGCTAYTDLRPNVDDCTPIDHMIVWWRIDAFNDGLGSLPGGYDFEGTNPDPSGFYPYGVHKILWVVEDMCGNKTTAEYTFEVVDCKKPSPVCINGLSSVVMPSSGEICVWAVDFDASSFDNCDSDLDYRIWYDGMDSTYYPDQTRDWRRPVAGDSGDDVLYYLPSSACFTCEGIGNGISGTFEVYVYVVDNYGNWDYCTTYIIIDDNDDVCPDNGSSIIAGGIENELGEVVDETMVTLQGGAGAQINRQQMNDNDGEFQFYVSPGYNWEVTSDRSDSYLNGVTAQDLSLIQRHIAGIEYLSSNYKLVAADADANMDIDIRDVLDLRKLLLGVYDELPANKSWRVLDADYTFPGITNRSLPAGIYDMENINLIDVTTDVMDVDFVGVKVGDVDNDALPNSLVAGQGRDEGALTFAASEVSFAAGEEVSVAITAENFNAMTAYQFSLRYDNSVLDFTGVEAGALNVTNDNFGTRFANRGVLTSVWYSANAVNASADEVLYTMTFKAKSSGQLSTSLSIASVVTEAMAFGNESGRTDIELTFTTETGEIVGDAYALFQNTPNPFASHTVIGFVLPEAANATLTVYDVNGKVITRADVDGVKGYNEVSMTRSQINATGVLYYQVETDGFSATKKMVVVE